MPYLHLRILGEPGPAILDAAAEQLTGLAESVLGKRREVTAVTLETIPKGHWRIGGRTARPAFHLEITITQGTNTREQKAAFIAQIWATMTDLVGELEPASYVVIHEVPGDTWGYQGLTQEARAIAARG